MSRDKKTSSPIPEPVVQSLVDARRDCDQGHSCWTVEFRHSVIEGLQSILLSRCDLEDHLTVLRNRLQVADYADVGEIPYRITKLLLRKGLGTAKTPTFPDSWMAALVLNPIGLRDLHEIIAEEMPDAWWGTPSADRPSDEQTITFTDENLSSGRALMKQIPSVQEWGNLYVCRFILEFASITSLCEVVDNLAHQKACEALGRCVEHMEDSMSHGETQSMFWDMDIEFHVTLARHAQFSFCEPLLHQAYRLMNRQLTSKPNWAPQPQLAVLDQHRKILDGITRRDLQAAMSAFAEHQRRSMQGWEPHVTRYANMFGFESFRWLQMLSSHMQQFHEKTSANLFKNLGANGWFIFASWNVVPIEMVRLQEFADSVADAVQDGAQLVYLWPSKSSLERRFGSEAGALMTRFRKEFARFRRLISDRLGRDHPESIWQVVCEFGDSDVLPADEAWGLFLYDEEFETLGTLTKRRKPGRLGENDVIEVVRPKRSLYLKWHDFLKSALEHAAEVPEGLIERMNHSREAAIASGSFVDVAEQTTR